MKTITATFKPVKSSLLLAVVLLATAITITLHVPDGTTIEDISIKTGITGPSSSTTVPGSSTAAVPTNSTATTPQSSTVTRPQSQTN